MTERIALPNGFREYRDIAVPAWATELGFRDESWGNDACARMSHDWHDGWQLTLWVDFANPEDRENGPSWPQFGLFIEEVDATGALIGTGHAAPLLETEKGSEMEAFVRVLLALPRDATSATPDLPPEGTRVRFRRDVDRFPHFIVPKGSLGTLSYPNGPELDEDGMPDIILVKVDEPVAGMEAWDNELQITQDGCDSLRQMLEDFDILPQ